MAGNWPIRSDLEPHVTRSRFRSLRAIRLQGSQVLTRSTGPNGIHKDQSNPRQFEHPVHANVCHGHADDPVEMVKSNCADGDEGQQNSKAAQRYADTTEMATQSNESDHHDCDASCQQCEDEAKLDRTSVFVPPLHFGNAAARGRECRLQIELFVHGEKEQDNGHNCPEPTVLHTDPRRCKAKNSRNRVTANSNPTHDGWVANARRPALRDAIIKRRDVNHVHGMRLHMSACLPITESRTDGLGR